MSDLQLRGATRRFIEGVVKKQETQTRSATYARIGIVVGTSPLTIGIAGGTVEVAKLESYTPTAGDRVLLLSTGGDLVCLGAIG